MLSIRQSPSRTPLPWSAAFYTVAYVGFGFPLMLASLSLTIDVAVLLAVLAGLCALFAAQQSRARL